MVAAVALTGLSQACVGGGLEEEGIVLDYTATKDGGIHRVLSPKPGKVPNGSIFGAKVPKEVAYGMVKTGFLIYLQSYKNSCVGERLLRGLEVCE